MGVVGLRVGVQPRITCFAFALPAAQYGVDQSGQLRTFEGACGIHGGGDGRVVAQLQDLQLHQAKHKQGVDGRILVSQRFFQQVVNRRIEAQPPACAVAQQRHQQRTVARIRQLGRLMLHDLAQRGAAHGNFGQALGSKCACVGFHCGRRNSGRALR